MKLKSDTSVGFDGDSLSLVLLLSLLCSADSSVATTVHTSKSMSKIRQYSRCRFFGYRHLKGSFCAHESGTELEAYENRKLPRIQSNSHCTSVPGLLASETPPPVLHCGVSLRGGAGGGAPKPAGRAAKKAVEEKTFGLKNKNKSKAVQKYVQAVQAQVCDPPFRDAADNPPFGIRSDRFWDGGAQPRAKARGNGARCAESGRRRRGRDPAGGHDRGGG